MLPQGDGPEITCCKCGTVLDDEAGEVVTPSVGCEKEGCSHWACLGCAGFKSEADAAKGGTWFCPLHGPPPPPRFLAYPAVVLRLCSRRGYVGR